MTGLLPVRLRFRGADGVRLAADAWGDQNDSPLLLLHGGGQTRGAWTAAAERIARVGYRVIALDLRGHGESDWSPDGDYVVDRFADDVRAVCESLARPAVLVGASLGGLCSLLAAGEPPQVQARALVLVDIAHRAEAAGVARIVGFMRSRPDGFASVEEAAAAVAAYLPHRNAPETLAGLRKNLRQQGGRWIWHWDPRLLDRFSTHWHLPASPERIVAAGRGAGAAMLVVRGALSDIVSVETAREFCAEVPGAEWVDVGGAAHMVVGDRNDRFLAAIVPFLQRLGS